MEREPNIEFIFLTTGFCALPGVTVGIGVDDGVGVLVGAGETGVTTGVLLGVWGYFCQIKDFFTTRQISFVLPTKTV